MKITPDELLSAEAAAAELHLQPGTLTTWRASGRGPNFVKIGRAIFYRRSDIAEWLGAQHQQPVTAKDRRAGAAA
jgi:predicted DNA-binding transcriptional regulator AlpA